MKKFKNLIFSTLLMLSATPQLHAEDTPSEEVKESSSGQTKEDSSAQTAESPLKQEDTTGNSYFPNTQGKKYHVRYHDGRDDSDTDTLPPEGVVDGATMVITKGVCQKVARTQQPGEKFLVAMFEPLEVGLTDAEGKPLANVRVLFRPEQVDEAEGPEVHIVPAGQDFVYAMTDKNGIATLDILRGTVPNLTGSAEKQYHKSVRAYHKDGSFVILATYGDAKASFNLTVKSPKESSDEEAVSSVTPPVKEEESLSKKESQPKKESPPEKVKDYSAMSYAVNSSDSPKKYSAYLMDCTGFDTDTLPPEGVVAGATMTIAKGDGQTLERTQDRNDKILTARFAPLQVCIKDSAGEPLENVRVLFQPDKITKIRGQAVQLRGSGPDLVYVMTDKNGIATLSLMWNHSGSTGFSADEMKRNKSVDAYYEDGPFSILATYGETKVSFHLTVGGA